MNAAGGKQMARPKQFFVLHPTPGKGGLTTVVLKDDGFTYLMQADFGRARLFAEVAKNDAGFRGRQWESTGAVGNGGALLGPVGDGQHASIRAAAQELLVKAEDYAATLEAARALGLVR